MAVAFATAVAAVACSDGQEPVTPHVHEAASITIEPTSATLLTGTEMDLQAAVRCGCGAVLSVPIDWRTSAQTVATVDAAGHVRAVSFGMALITGVVEGLTHAIPIEVQPLGTVAGSEGATVRSEDGRVELEIPRGALERAVDVVLEKVDESGYAPDALFITGTAYRVRPEGLELNRPARLRMHVDPAWMPEGVYPQQLRLREREHAQQRWRVLDGSRCLQWTVETAIERFGTFGVTVQPAEGSMIGPEGGTVAPEGQGIELTIPGGALDEVVDIVVRPVADDAMGGVARFIPGTAWELLPDGVTFNTPVRLALSFDPASLPAGVPAGWLRVHERARNGDGWEEATHAELRENVVEGLIGALGTYGIVALTPDRVPVGRVTLMPVSMDVEVGDIVQLTATVHDPDDIPLDRPVEWTIDRRSIASVDAAGEVTARRPGQATITASAGGVSATADINVRDGGAAAVALVLEPSTLLLDAGETADLTATVLDATGAALDVAVSWTTSDAKVAPLIGKGRIKGAAVGTALVVARYGRVADTTRVTVRPKQVAASIVIEDPGHEPLHRGGTKQLIAKAYDAAGAPVDVELVWTTSDAAVATVDANGLVTAIDHGTALIEATAGTVCAGVEIRVGGAGGGGGGGCGGGSGGDATILVTPVSLLLEVGGTAQLTAEVRNKYGEVHDVDLDWRSSDAAVATVTGTGLVTATGLGTAVITAIHKEAEATATVIVASDPGPVRSVVVEDPGHEPLEIGATRQLAAWALGADGQPVAAELTWASSDTDIATVDGAGLVTGVGRGTASITAMAGLVGSGVQIRVVGEEGGEEGGHNLSWPVVFVDGIGLTGLPPSDDPGVRPGPTEGITVDALPFFWESNEPTHGSYYEQRTFNTWRAEWLDGAGQPAFDASVTWGDNITHQTWATTRPIRVEVALTATGVGTLTGFNMFALGGEGPDEVQATDGTTAEFVPLIYTVEPQLIVRKLDGPGGSAVATALSGTMKSEVNVAGRVIYGQQLRPDEWTLPDGMARDGWYRLIFRVTGNLRLTDVGNTEGTYLPIVKSATESVLDIYIKP